MAGEDGRRGGRALRALVVLATAAAALGGWSPPGHSDSVPTIGAAAASVLPEALTAPERPDPLLLRVEVPRGFDTVAARAAADAEAARIAADATAAAAATTAAEVTAARTTADPRTVVPDAVHSAPRSAGLPLGVDPGSSDQVVTVVAPSAGATSARLTAWQRGPEGWTPVLGPVNARIGAAGVGRASERTTRTPMGTFALTEAFGRAGDPGTALPYRVVDGDDWWVSDVHSARYNQYAQCAPSACDFDESASENLAEEPAYQHAIVIDYNRGGTPGAGSAFFLHVSNGAATAGCVAIDAGSLVTLMQWLDPAARPLIAIGVG